MVTRSVIGFVVCSVVLEAAWTPTFNVYSYAAIRAPEDDLPPNLAGKQQFLYTIADWSTLLLLLLCQPADFLTRFRPED